MKIYLFAALTALLLTLAAGYVVLPLLKRLKIGQSINESISGTHAAKEGTPTMGGVIFLSVGTLVSLGFSFARSISGHLYLYCLFCMLAFALIGGADDLLKVLLHRNEGFTPKQKLIPQVVFAIVFAVLAYVNPEIGSAVRIPFTGTSIDLGVLYIPFTAFVIIAVDNSVNLLDGLDGLCSGSSMINFAFFCALSVAGGAVFKNVGIFALVMCACLIGFHRFNAHPARVFMGDVGSLGLGALLAAMAVVTNSMLILPLVMFTSMISTLSDILQVIYMRRHNGRKLFRMTPVHHHFELAGVPEERIVTTYNIITFALCLIGLIALV